MTGNLHTVTAENFSSIARYSSMCYLRHSIEALLDMLELTDDAARVYYERKHMTAKEWRIAVAAAIHRKVRDMRGEGVTDVCAD